MLCMCTVVTVCLKHAVEKNIDNTTHAYTQHLRYTVQWESTRVCTFTDNNRAGSIYTQYSDSLKTRRRAGQGVRWHV